MVQTFHALSGISPEDLSVAFDFESAALTNRPGTVRRLSDLHGCFQDKAAWETALKEGDPVIYEVTSVEPAHGEGQLHWGIGILNPGKISREDFLTKGHLHEHRPTAEVYLGLSGEGAKLLEHESTGESKLVPLGRGRALYVPGHTTHRTVNTGQEPLTYIRIYPSNAGHDYGAIAQRNFRMVVVEQEGRPNLELRL